MLMINASTKTSWFRLGVILLVTFISLWFIKEAFAKPFINWQTYNEIRTAEIRALAE